MSWWGSLAHSSRVRRRSAVARRSPGAAALSRQLTSYIPPSVPDMGGAGAGNRPQNLRLAAHGTLTTLRLPRRREGLGDLRPLGPPLPRLVRPVRGAVQLDQPVECFEDADASLRRDRLLAGLHPLIALEEQRFGL